MTTDPTPIRIGIYGSEERINHHEPRGCALWPAGYGGTISAAGGTPMLLPQVHSADDWDEVLNGIDGVVFAMSYQTPGGAMLAVEDALCQWCRIRRTPLLAIDQGLLVLNSTFGGTLYADLARELPDALQHRHPPEKGLRHAINIELGTRMADLYGEGEVVVNSEHRRAVQRVARGFRVGARALDGVIEAIETEDDDWFALGVQWHPASASASGLDIQLFRGLVDRCRQRQQEVGFEACSSAA